MSDPGRCSSCGLPLDPPGPAGLCPACLLKMGLAAGAGTTSAEAAPGGPAVEATGASAGSSAMDADVTIRPSGDAGHGGPLAAAAAMADVPRVIGPYHLLQALGEGGMGVVYLAEQREPLVRRVALKLIKPGMDTREVLARFEAERQALALMDHPHIARVLDAGLGPHNRPYFVMEYVAGLPLTDYCDRHRLRNADRLQLFLSVCAALQHAHQKGVIHRDLKPSNILVALQDGKPVPKVIDFGIAKATRQGSVERAAFTQFGMLIGTPEYMSPEQAEASGLEVDTTTDIYSLGVILYELLTGVLPFDAETLRRAGYFEMHRIIREQDPPKPSTRVTALGATAAEVARHHQTTPPALGKQLRGDLDAIALKAMEKDRTRRYASASEFAADITRYLNGEAVIARPPSVLYRTRKFVRRHRVGVAAATLVIAALVVGLAMSTAFYVRAEGARRDAERDRVEAQRQAYVATISAVDLHLRAGETAEATRRLSETPATLRGWEWQHLFFRTDSSLAALYAQGELNWSPSLWSSFRFSTDGTRLFWNSETALNAWDAQTYRPLFRYGGFNLVMAIGPDGLTVVTPATVPGSETPAGDTRAYALRIMEASTRRVIQTFGVERQPEYAAFSPDGRRLASSSADGTMNVWAVESGRRLASMKTSDGEPCPLSFSPDGRLLAGPDLWDSFSGRLVAVLPSAGERSRAVSFSHDSRLLATGARRGTLRIFDAGSGALRTALRAHAGEVYSIAFSPNDRRVATSANDAIVRVWEVASGEEVAALNGHGRLEQVNSLAFDRSGDRLFSAGRRAQIRVWNTKANGTGIRMTQDCPVVSLAFGAGDSRLATGSQDGSIRIWDVRNHRPTALLRGHTGGVLSVAFNRAGTCVVSGGVDRSVRIWDAAAGTPGIILEGHSDGVNAVAFSPGGTEVASASDDGSLRVWDALSGTELARWNADYPVNSLQFNEAGDAILFGAGHPNAAGGFTRTAGLWRWRSRTIAAMVDGRRGDPVVSVALSKDGRTIVLGGFGHMEAAVWDGSLKTRLGAFTSADTLVGLVALNPAASRMMSAWSDTIRVWDVASRSLLLTLRDQASVSALAMSADGAQVATASGNGISLWDSRSAYHPDALQLVDQLTKQLVLADAVTARLRSDEKLDPALRAAALRIVQARGDVPRRVNSLAWEAVKGPGGKAEAYRVAAGWAERAVQLAPWAVDYLNTLGVAQYRAGEWKEAVATLERAAAMRKSPSPEDLAFLVMAHQRLGNVNAARDALEKLRAEMKKPNNATNEKLQDFLREAEALIAGAGDKPATPSTGRK